MPETQTERAEDAGPIRTDPPPLTASIRHHLGSGLRSLYDQTPAAPIDERIEALLVRLERPKS